MKISKQKFQNEIEIEHLWVTTELGKYVFFIMMPFSILIVVGLWDMASHRLLLSWLVLLTLVNLFRWMILRYYRGHKEKLIRNVKKFKYLIMLSAILTGLCWALCLLFFLKPSVPTTVLITYIPAIIEVIGGMLTWFTYRPAVIAISFPPSLTGVCLLLAEGGKTYQIAAIMTLILPFLSIFNSLKLAGMQNYALRLNFENVALRQKDKEKSIMLETALENMAQGISMSDQNDRLKMWNQQFIQLLGTVGTKATLNADLESLLNAAVPPLIIPLEGSTQYRTQEGQVYEIRQSMLNQGGRVLTYSDISDLINREQALEKARKDAEQANAAKTRFLASASHDLRQPIHALGLFFAELSELVQNAETAPLIAQVEDAIAAINSMLNALLDVSKLDAGIVKPIVEPVNLNELFVRFGAEFQPLLTQNNNELRFRTTEFSVATDAAMLERILRNLIGNALRYVVKGRILVAARRRGQRVVIQVIDTGPGIPEDQFENIFIEFHQLHNAARDRRQGLGLGLAIVKRLANLLQHPITVTSRLGKGSCFAVSLPLIQSKPQLRFKQTQALQVQPDYSLTDRQVMIVDDDVTVLESMKGLLSRWGCLVRAANSAEQAFDELAVFDEPLELLIIDYRLQNNISGIDVARAIQSRLRYPLAILIVTGDTGPERLQEADTCGFPLLHKPVQPAKLRSTIHYLLRKRSKEG